MHQGIDMGAVRISGCRVHDKAMGLVNSCFQDESRLMKSVSAIALEISKKSPLTIRGIKNVLNYNQDKNLRDGLDYVANWNAASLFSSDVNEIMQASFEKREPNFKS